MSMIPNSTVRIITLASANSTRALPASPFFCPVHFLVGDRAELALHFLRQLDAVFVLQQVRDATFAGLAIDANDLAVLAANVVRINGQVWHVPMLLAASFPLGQALLDRVLVRAAERGEDQLAGIRMTRRHRHAGAPLIDLADGVEIGEVELGIDAMHVEV